MRAHGVADRQRRHVANGPRGPSRARPGNPATRSGLALRHPAPSAGHWCRDLAVDPPTSPGRPRHRGLPGAHRGPARGRGLARGPLRGQSGLPHRGRAPALAGTDAPRGRQPPRRGRFAWAQRHGQRHLRRPRWLLAGSGLARLLGAGSAGRVRDLRASTGSTERPAPPLATGGPRRLGCGVRGRPRRHLGPGVRRVHRPRPVDVLVAVSAGRPATAVGADRVCASSSPSGRSSSASSGGVERWAWSGCRSAGAQEPVSPSLREC